MGRFQTYEPLPYYRPRLPAILHPFFQMIIKCILTIIPMSITVGVYIVLHEISLVAPVDKAVLFLIDFITYLTLGFGTCFIAFLIMSYQDWEKREKAALLRKPSGDPENPIFLAKCKPFKTRGPRDVDVKNENSTKSNKK